MPKLFVFDTNALISANLSNKSVNRRAFLKALESGVVVSSAATFEEFKSTFMRPKFEKYLSADERKEAIVQLEKMVYFISVSLQITASQDPDDNMFLALALTAGAECIVTGDKGLLSLDPFNGISIVTASKFLDLYP